MTRRILASSALMIGAALSAPGCFWTRCECPDQDVFPLPGEGVWDVSDISVEDHYSGGGSESWDWNHASPWGDVLRAEVRLERGQLFVEYTTRHGTFLAAFEETDSSDF